MALVIAATEMLVFEIAELAATASAWIASQLTTLTSAAALDIAATAPLEDWVFSAGLLPDLAPETAAGLSAPTGAVATPFYGGMFEALGSELSHGLFGGVETLESADVIGEAGNVIGSYSDAFYDELEFGSTNMESLISSSFYPKGNNSSDWNDLKPGYNVGNIEPLQKRRRRHPRNDPEGTTRRRKRHRQK